MKKIRKTVATALSLLCLVAALSPAYAVGTTEDTPQGVIEPRYTGLSQLWASLSIDSNGTASCLGKAIIRSGYTGDLTVVLQKSTNGEDWTEVETWDLSGTGSLLLSESISVSRGYQYQVVTIVDVFTSGGSFVEDSEIASRVVDFY